MNKFTTFARRTPPATLAVGVKGNTLTPCKLHLDCHLERQLGRCAWRGACRV